MKIKAALFRNTRKTEDRQPDYTGTGDVEGGGKVRLSAWLRTSQAGQKYFSIAIEDERPREAVPGGAAQPPLSAGPPTRQPATPAPQSSLAHIAAGDVDAGAPPPDDGLLPF